MLYKLNEDNNIEKIPFMNFSDQGKLEKDLENLLAENLTENIFEKKILMPIFQERSRQEEADIYALDENGDLVVFELKRSTAGKGSLEQLFRYVTEAGTWGYSEIEIKYKKYLDKKGYIERDDINLAERHKDVFELENQLSEDQFNNNQHMWVVGSAANDSLIRGVNFWKNKGLSIDFLPYRIYRISEELYFEFFAKPYDGHINPGNTKGIIFDTNKSYDKEGKISSLESMISQNRISAYGSRKDAVKSLKKDDLVFYYHKGKGIVAAAKVSGRRIKKEPDEWYWDVEFLTRVPKDFNDPKAMSYKEVKKVTDQQYFMARIQKAPYLSYEEAEHLLDELKLLLGE